MGWNGTHPTIGKSEARALLFPAPCKRCVYRFRVFQMTAYCHRCGVGKIHDAPRSVHRAHLLRWA